MATSTGGQNLCLTNPLLSSRSLTSKYVTTDRSLLGAGSKATQTSTSENSLLGAATLKTQASTTPLARAMSSLGEKGPLSSSSNSSLLSGNLQAMVLTSGQNLSNTATTTGHSTTNFVGSQKLLSKTGSTSSSTSLRLHTTSLAPVTNSSVTSKSLQSSIALTSFSAMDSRKGLTKPLGSSLLAKPSGDLGRSSLLARSSGDLGRSTLLARPSGNLGRSTLLSSGGSSIVTSNALLNSPTPYASKRPLSFKTTSLLLTSAEPTTSKKELFCSASIKTTSSLLTGRPITKTRLLGISSASMLSSHVASERRLPTSKPNVLETVSAAPNKKLVRSESQRPEPAVSITLTKPITADTEGAPKYDFSLSVKPTKKELFVSPDLDPSIQTPPTPAVNVAELKMTLVNAVATSLLCSPDFRSPKDPSHKALTSLGAKLSCHDPEFVLKLGIYTRLNLNIRTTANFLVALAAKLPACRPYLRKYYSATIKLPSDWIEVAEIYQAFQDENIKSGAIPTALRKVMASKFSGFDAYQLAKYNKEKSKKSKTKKPTKADREKKKGEKEEKERKVKYSSDFPALKSNDESDSDDDDDDSSVVLSDSESKEEIERLSFTLKQLVRKIHISEPVEYVMCLVGKKYPEDAETFRKSRLPGLWDQDRAGKRMKLPTPETWETQVSTKGNKASTWQSLIDHNKLPFMAMLRNLRNLILAGVSAKHHQWAIKKLNDEYAVVNSKQFPFRFFSAYEVLGGLEKLADGEAPPARRGAKKKKATKEPPEIDKSILQKYRTALDNALKIATCYNVKPIPGSTLILCNVGSNMDRPCTAARGLGKPRKVLEVGVLLGLMCKYSCERSTMLIYGGSDHFTEVQLEEGTILHNMQKVMAAASANNLTGVDGYIPFAFLREMLVDRHQVDNVVLLTDAMKLNDEQGREMMDFLKKYRHFVNPELLFVSVDLSGATSGVSSTITPGHPNDIYLAGYSDQILRFIAERGDSGQLTYVENIDRALNLTGIKIPSLAETADERQQLLSLSSERALLSAAQGQRWRTLRIFISSTFRDMHGERDLLTRFVFPELRARAHSRQIHVYEVDLRWGVTEQDARSHKALEICLDEISRSQYFIGLLSQRYGWIQDEYQVPDTPKYDWLRELPTHKSITEVEMHHAALCDTDKAVNKAFFYFRDPAFISDVPTEYKEDFESESEEAFEKIETLKSNILLSGLEVYSNYPCRWLGEVQNKLMVGGLESFGQRVLYNLWNAVQRDYREDEMETDPITQATHQHNAFAESRASTFIGRRQLLQKAKAALESPDNKLVLVTGKAGCGKSAFMAAVAQEYSEKFSSRVPVNLVITHFIGAAPGSGNVSQLLTRLCHELKRRFEVRREVPSDYTDLARDWQHFLEESVTNLGNTSTKIVVLIDGVDLLEDKHNGRSLDWIPSDIPDGVVLLVSGMDGGMGITNLRKRKNPPPAEVSIGSLDMFDKAEMVRKKLHKHRKTLDESPFNNQMKLLVTKKEAVNPLFLHLACEELRFFGVFEEVTGYLKKMPTTITNLLQDILLRLEAEHTTDVLSTAMLLLTVVRNGLLEYELTEVLQLSLAELDGEREGTLPPMVVTKLLRSLQSFLQPTGEETADMLALAHKDIEKAVKLRYTRGTASKKENQLHLLLAKFFRAEVDPTENGTFVGKSARAFTELPYHLLQAGAWKELEELVCNINFIVAKCQLGLAHQLVEDYTPATIGASAAKSRELSKFIQLPAVEECKSFVSRNLHVLLKSPSLALQQALNEPNCSVVGIASREAHWGSSSSMMIWLNKPDTVNPCQMNISSQTGAILCVAVSPDSSLFAAGFNNGAVRVYEVATGKEAHTFIGHAAGISDVCFVGTQSVCSASQDTTLSLWDTKQGIRMATLRGHSRGVHGCAADKSGKSVVSVSWDTHIKVWEGRSGKLLSTLKTQGQHNTPINCVSFHPEGQLVVVGSWDSTLKVWDTFNQKRLKVLKGHKSSIQACSYAPSGRHIVSAALDGEVKVWSTRSGTAVGTITGHHSPVNGISFTPNGQFLATASSDKVVKVWSGSLGQPIGSMGSADLGFVHQLVFDHMTQTLSAGYHDGSIRCFNVQTGAELLAAKPHPSPMVGLAHHRNLHMAAYTDGKIVVLDLGSPSNSVALQGHTSPITCAVWGKSGLASASEDFCIFMWPHQLQVYTKMLLRKQVPPRTAAKRKGSKGATPSKTSVTTELVVKPLGILRTQHTGKITSISFSCDGVMMAASSHDRSVSLWSCLSQQLVKMLPSCHKDWVTTCCFSDSSPSILFTGSTDFTLKVWDVSSGAQKMTFKGHTSAINSVTTSQGCVVSAAFDGSVKVWTHKGVEITTMHCHRQRVNTCVLHVPSRAAANQLTSSWADLDDEESDQKTKVQLEEIVVLTGSDDGTVGVWKPFLPNEIASLIGHSDRVLSVSSTLNNQLLTSSLDGSIRMWSPPLSSTTHHGALTLKNTSKGHTGPVTSISTMNVGQDTIFAVSGGRDGYVGVWEVTPQEVSRLYLIKDSEKAVGSVCFTSGVASGFRQFMTGSGDGSLKCYKFDRKTFQSTSQIAAASLMGAHPLSKLVMTEDGKSVVAGSWSKKVTAISISKKSTTGMGQQNDLVMDLATAGEKVYSIGHDNMLFTWVLPSGNSTNSSHSSKNLHLKTPSEQEPTLALSLCLVPGTNYLAVGDSKGKVSLWNLANQRMELSKKLHSKQVNVVSPVATGWFMTGSDDATVKVWTTERRGRAAHVTQVGQFYCQACVTAISTVQGEGKLVFVVGDSLGHVTVLQWQQ